MEFAGSYGTALVVWFISGLLALCGALCYAELGTMLPMNGGETVYLGRAFGGLVSFMFEFVTIAVQKVSAYQSDESQYKFPFLLAWKTCNYLYCFWRICVSYCISHLLF